MSPQDRERLESELAEIAARIEAEKDALNRATIERQFAERISQIKARIGEEKPKPPK